MINVARLSKAQTVFGSQALKHKTHTQNIVRGHYKHINCSLALMKIKHTLNACLIYSVSVSQTWKTHSNYEDKPYKPNSGIMIPKV